MLPTGVQAHSDERDKAAVYGEHGFTLMGFPSSAVETGAGVVGRGSPCRGLLMATPPLVHHSTMAPRFGGRPRFLQELSGMWSASPVSPQAVSMQPTAVFSPGLLSQPHTSAPSPCLHWQTAVSSWGAQAMTRLPPVQCALLPGRAPPQVQNPSSPSAPPSQGVWVPSCSLFPFSPLFLLHPTWPCWDLFLSFKMSEVLC